MSTHHRLDLFDIDGVLADERHRVHHALSKDWGAYFDPDMMMRDGVWPQGREAYLRSITEGADVGYLTGRREDTRPVTEKWLRRRSFNADLPMIMRMMHHTTKGGYPLPTLKRLIVQELTYVYDEVRLFDDDPEVCAAVGQVQGAVAIHCTWHIKPSKLVRQAVA